MRRFAFAIVLLLVVAPVRAQQQGQQVFNLQVSESDLNVIGQALAKMPYEVSAGVIARLTTQVNAAIEAEKKASEQKAKKK